MSHHLNSLCLFQTCLSSCSYIYVCSLPQDWEHKGVSVCLSLPTSVTPFYGFALQDERLRATLISYTAHTEMKRVLTRLWFQLHVLSAFQPAGLSLTLTQMRFHTIPHSHRHTLSHSHRDAHNSDRAC